LPLKAAVANPIPTNLGLNEPPVRLVVSADADPRGTTNTSKDADRTNVERI